MKRMKKLAFVATFALLLTACQQTPPVSSSTTDQTSSEPVISSTSDSTGVTSTKSESSEAKPEILSIEGARLADEPKSFFMVVDKNTVSVSLSDKVKVSKGCTWSLFRADTEIRTKVAAGSDGTLAPAENVFHILVNSETSKAESTYKLTIYQSFDVKINYYFQNKVFESETVPSGYEYTLLENPNIKGYTFQKWQDKDKNDVDKITPWEKSFAFYAVAKANDYDIPLELNGGELDVTTFGAIYDSKYTLPTPTRPNYSFDGWAAFANKEGEAFDIASQGTWVYDNVVKLSAKWKAIEFAITYSLNGGTNNPHNPSKYTVESDVALEEPTYNHYDFLGWYLDDEKVDTILGEWAENITLEAKWAIQQHDVQFVNDDGSLLYETTANYGSYVGYFGPVPHSALKEEPQEGYSYEFLGWVNGDKEYSSSPKVEGDSVFVANYGEAKKYVKTIQYIDEDGSDLGIYDAYLADNGRFSFRKPLPYDALTNYSIFDITDSYKGETEADWVFQVSHDEVKGITISNNTVKPAPSGDKDKVTELTIPVVLNGINVFKADLSNCSYVKSVFIPRTISFSFYKCPSLKSVTLTSSVSSIEGNAFYGCTSLTELTIPSSVTSIGDYAFSGCTSLTELTIPDGVTSIGSNALYDCSSLESLSVPCNLNIKIPKSVKTLIITKGGTGRWLSNIYPFQNTSIGSLIIKDGVTSIGSYAFSGCSSLREITIPSSVTSIGSYAFSGCSSLKEITIPSSVTSIGLEAFSGCTSLTELTIPDSVTSIGRYAFSGCSSLKSLTIPSSVTSIGDSAFSGCPSLMTISVDPDNQVYDSRDNCNAVVKTETNSLVVGCANTIIPSSVTSIGQEAFSGCSSLKEITIPSSVTSIGWKAFDNCSSIKEIAIPDGVASIGNYAFSGCVSIESLIIRAPKTNLDSSVFEGCNGIKSLTVPDNLSTYGINTNSLERLVILPGSGVVKRDPYRNCEVKTVIIEDGVTSIGDYAFSGCSSLKEISIPSSVTSIGSESFRDCTSLTELDIPSSVTSIGGGAFSGCSSLKEITIPSSVTSIGWKAFDNCSSIKEIAIPDGVTSIGNYAFYGCSSLKEISIPSSVTSIGYGAFSGCSFKTLDTPAELLSDFDLTQVCYLTVSSNGSGVIKEYAVKDRQSLIRVTIINIASIGNYAFSGCSSLREITIPSSVTYIGDRAFSGCSSLKEITIPSSVTSIGGGAFYDCDALADTYISVSSVADLLSMGSKSYLRGKVHLVDGDGQEIESVEIPDGVTSIGSGAFSGCSSLREISIPSSVTSIGSSAFYGCSSLREISIPSSVTSIGLEAFSGCDALADTYISVSSVADLLSMGSKSYLRGKVHLVDGDGQEIESVEIPDGVTSIGSGAFSGCSSLREITIPTSVTSIGSSAFYGCSSLREISIPSSVTSIGLEAFRGCSSLGEISIPSSVTSIGDRAFSGCPSLMTISVDPDNQVYDSRDNCNAVVKTETNSLVVGCANTIIPTSVTSIGDAAFYGCSFLREITIPTSVTSIGLMAFSGCPSLMTISVDPDNQVYDSRDNCNAIVKTETNSLVVGCANTIIPTSVTSIGDSAFSGCSSLKEISIPSSVTSIWFYAFSDCASLESVTIPDSVTTIGDYAFLGCSSLKSLIIPSSVTYIGNNALNGCESLASITFPAGLNIYTPDATKTVTITAINGEGTIKQQNYQNRHWELVTIQNGVTSIGSNAFQGCSSLKEISIPSSVTSIGSNAFFGCPSLMTISVDPDNQVYDSRDNCNAVVKTETNSLVVGCANTTIPSSVTSIGSYAFSGCSSLKEITIPSSVTSIGQFAFSGCTSLESVTIPDGVTSLALGNFENCSSLKEISIPSSVTSIGQYVFRGCSSLKEISIPSSVTSIWGYAFSDCTSLESVTIPDGVASLSGSVFLNCTSLTTIVIPTSISSIEGAAFSTTALGYVFYKGTAGQYKKITISNAGSMFNNPYYYSENEPLSSGNYWHYVDGVPAIWKE